MIKHLVLSSIIFQFAGMYLFSQNLNGIWKGELYQEPQKTFYFEIRIQNTKGNKIAGTTYIESKGLPSQLGSKKGDYGTLEFGGVWNGEDVIIQESGIVQQEKSSSFYWCIKRAMLKLSKTNKEWTLSGPWTSVGGCMPGKLTVTKKVKTVKPKDEDRTEPIEPVDSMTNIEPIKPVDPEDSVTTVHRAYEDSVSTRKLDVKYNLVVDSAQLVLKVWDNDLVDGDIISLSLNGTWILKEHTVTKGKKKIFVRLTEKENILVLFAENLGSKPPNTAAITINDGKKEQTIILNSDKGKSEAVKISQR
jgi:hypothetical protein